MTRTRHRPTPAALRDLGKLVTHWVPRASLNPAPYNPRSMSEREAHDLRESLRRFGFVEPLVVNNHPSRLGIVVGGHQRLKIAAELSIDPVPVVYVSLDEDRERELNLRLNKNLGSWDWNLLASFKLDLLRDVGFQDQDLSVHLNLGGDSAPAAADAMPDKVATRVKPGDLWLLGPHRLYCGDSCTPIAHKQACGVDRLADCVWTDPPYGVSYDKGKVMIENDHLRGDELKRFLAAGLGLAIAQTRRGGAMYVACAGQSIGENLAAFADAGARLAQILVWAKSGFVPGRADYQYQHELVLYGWREGAAHRWMGGRDKPTIFAVPKPASSEEHPTMKPVELVRRMIVNSTMPRDLVLDPFAGSGSTLLAAELAQRTAALIEIKPAYCDVILARWEKLTGKKAEVTGRARKRSGRA